MSQERREYQRGETQFFHAPATKRALISLSESSSFLIYCGAGVTIDRTGLGWGELIERVFAPSADSPADYPTPREIEALANSVEPLHLASILTQYVLDASTNRRDLAKRLTPKLQTQLYKSNVWQSGRLARNVAAIAVGAATLGKNVTVITTNYDIHIEQSIFKERNRQDANGSRDLPSIRIVVADLAQPVQDKPAVGSAGCVELIYLHGRVPDNGANLGQLVVSEADYAATRPRTVGVLRRLFAHEGAAVLILGTSLTDAPLVESLLETSLEVPRVALIPVASTAYRHYPPKLARNLIRHVRRRGELLGVDLLMPDFKFQVSQFCEELMQCITAIEGARAFLSDGAGRRYGLRLQKWWETWSALDKVTDPEACYLRLNASFQNIRAFVMESAEEGHPESKERFRLELWVRESPSAKCRRLTLWSTSGGPISDRETLRSADLEIDSENASVRAFTEGRPQQFSVEDLLIGRNTSARWKSYLSVPIYVTVDQAKVPVGVVTMASDTALGKSVLPLPKVTQMGRLVEQMIGFGRSELGLGEDSEE